MAINGVSTHVRISGLASGLDTDTMVSDLMKAERIPLDKVLQKKQLKLWQQEQYRSITQQLSDFNKAFMDVANPSTNMRSSAQYKKFTVGVTNSSGAASIGLTASGTVNASVGSQTVIVKSLATSMKATSALSVSAPLKTGILSGNLALAGKKVSITIDGMAKDIAFDSDANITDQASGDAFAAQLENNIKDIFGTGINNELKVTASYDHASGTLTFGTGGGTNKITFASAKTDDGLGILGMYTGSSNRINTSSSLASLKDTLGLTFYDDAGTDKLKFSINGREFTFDTSTSFNTVIHTINNDAVANVNFAYDSITDKFTLASKQTGAGKKISIANTWGNFFGETSATKIDHTAIGFGTGGQDAVVSINGKEIVRSSNTFTENGITYNLIKADPTETHTVNLSIDVNGIYDNIKNFITKYNEILDTINGKINAVHDRDYLPLTDAQKESMKDTDIEKWEEKAKTGLLRNDTNLRKIVDEMRLKLIEPIEGVNITLASIGIASQSYADRGKLTVNETKLKQAIVNDPDAVMNLFSKQSTILPSYDRKATAEDRTSRYKQEGMVNRLYDIIQDNISIMMDSNKKKGFLLEKAGQVGDTTDATSMLSKQIRNDLELIDKWENKLSKKEENYYKKFTAMETAMSKLSSQASWISSQLSALTNG